MDHDHEQPPGAAAAATLAHTLSQPRACDECKRRKVKCDALTPCANCTISDLRCEHRTVPRKRGRPSKSTRPRSPSPASASLRSDYEVPAPAGQSPVTTTTTTAATSTPRPSATVTQLSQHQGQTPSDSIQRVTSANPPASSPGSTFSPRYAIPRNHSVLDASEICRKLVDAVEEQLQSFRPGSTIFGCVCTCIDLWLKYHFPNTPIAHEPTLRESAAIFEGGQLSSVFPSADDDQPPSSRSTFFLGPQRACTVITALCAFVFSALPSSLLPGPKELVWPFYHASRAMLKLYEEFDLENPNSSSYYIRTWQSAALQNTTGRDWASWHIHGEGTMLALRARIYDEAVISHLPQHETSLLRMNFWLMYLADKTAAAFEARPYVINDAYLAGKLTLQDDPSVDACLLDSSRACNQNDLECRLLAGFHLKRSLWATAADMVQEISHFITQREQLNAQRESETEVQTDGLFPPLPQAKLVEKLMDKYLRFVSLADHLPAWLQSPNSAVESAEASIREYQATTFWVQRSNIMTVCHCMRLLILQKCVDIGVPEIVGLSSEPVAVTMQKLQIVHDFISELQLAPFTCFKAQGESAVERVRRVGGILLAIVNGPPTASIEARARHQLGQLLDILASLDSKATDDLDTPEFPSSTHFCF